MSREPRGPAGKYRWRCNQNDPIFPLNYDNTLRGRHFIGRLEKRCMMRAVTHDRIRRTRIGPTVIMCTCKGMPVNMRCKERWKFENRESRRWRWREVHAWVALCDLWVPPRPGIMWTGKRYFLKKNKFSWCGSRGPYRSVSLPRGFAVRGIQAAVSSLFVPQRVRVVSFRPREGFTFLRVMPPLDRTIPLWELCGRMNEWFRSVWDHREAPSNGWYRKRRLIILWREG